MITDAFLQFDAANANIRAAATYLSTNTIDLSLARDIGAGETLKVLYNVDVAFAGGASVQPQIITADSADLATNATVRVGGVAILEAALVQGAMFVQYIPELLNGIGGLGSKGQRYLGVQYVSLGVHTAGSISARIVKDVADIKFYPAGYTIL